MRKLILILVVLSSCGIKWSQRYDTAITSISYHRDKNDLVLMNPGEIKLHPWLLNKKDTIRLTWNRKNFGIRDLRTKEIFLFRFGWDDSYTTIQCDSAWNIVQVSGYLGDVY